MSWSIKNKVEDFVVEEIIDLTKYKEGPYFLYLLEKENRNTIDIVNFLIKKNKCKVTYAGLKDKFAITKQYITSNKKLEYLPEGINLEFLRMINDLILPGDLTGNKFIIKVEGEYNFKQENKFTNYFGEQRFSKNNVKYGLLILKKKFKEFEESTGKSLQETNKKIAKIYINAVQSFIWNLSLSEKINSNEKIEISQQVLSKKVLEENILWPIVGYSSRNLPPEVEKVLKKLGLNHKDFICRRVPEISAPGDERKAIANIKELSYQKKTVSFKLEKGTYATVALKYLISPCNSYNNND